MKTIVFGGSGFLGSHLADALSEAGHKVTVFDLKASAHLRKDQTMIVGDILDESAVGRAVRGQDALYNFAGFADIEAAQDKPLETIRANILGNAVLLEAARKNRVKRFIFASSVYVYSQAGSFYRASKQACEAYIESYQKLYGLPFTILRFGSLYGPRADMRNGIYRLVRQAVVEKKIDYWGNGEEIREYIHVRDAALCGVDVLAREYENECVILTGSQPMKVRDFLVMLGEMLDHKVKIGYHKPLSAQTADLHYAVTPYSFAPREGKKLVRSHYTDLGQGILGIMGEVYGRHKKT